MLDRRPPLALEIIHLVILILTSMWMKERGMLLIAALSGQGLEQGIQTTNLDHQGFYLDI